MIKVTQKKNIKSPLLKIVGIIFLFVLSITCVKLAFWQIDRGDEKDSIYKNYVNSLNKEAAFITQLADSYEDFTPIKIKGLFIKDKQYLLDNQVYNKKAGYDVLTPLVVSDEVVLINRGWVFNNDRTKIPDISIESMSTEVRGYVYTYKNAFVLEADTFNTAWPKTIQSINHNQFKAHFDKKLKPYVIIMSDKQNESYIIREKYKTNEKLKHYMYAGQWIIFSLIGFYLCLFLIRSSFWIKEK